MCVYHFNFFIIIIYRWWWSTENTFSYDVQYAQVRRHCKISVADIKRPKDLTRLWRPFQKTLARFLYPARTQAAVTSLRRCHVSFNLDKHIHALARRECAQTSGQTIRCNRRLFDPCQKWEKKIVYLLCGTSESSNAVGGVDGGGKTTQ